MSPQLERATGRFLVRRLDDDEVFELFELTSASPEQPACADREIRITFKTYECIDGRSVSTQDGVTFYFDHESWRVMHRITSVHSGGPDS